VDPSAPRLVTIIDGHRNPKENVDALNQFEVRVSVMGCHSILSEYNPPMPIVKEDTLQPSSSFSLQRSHSYRAQMLEDQYFLSKPFSEHTPKEILFGKQVNFTVPLHRAGAALLSLEAHRNSRKT
jgi:hypothetical protein